MAKTMNELIEALKKSMRSSLTKDSSPDDIKKVESYEKSLDEMNEEHNRVVKEKEEVTQLYIEASKKDVGSKDSPEDEDKQEATSLEDIAQELVAQEKKS